MLTVPRVWKAQQDDRTILSFSNPVLVIHLFFPCFHTKRKAQFPLNSAPQNPGRDLDLLKSLFQHPRNCLSLGSLRTSGRKQPSSSQNSTFPMPALLSCHFTGGQYQGPSTLDENAGLKGLGRGSQAASYGQLPLRKNKAKEALYAAVSFSQKINFCDS